MPDNNEQPKKNGKPTSAQIKQKYAKNPYVTGGREQWGEYLETKKLPFSGHSVKQAVYNAANTTKINPSLLYASAMEEGLREGIDNPDTVSEAYLEAIGELADDKGIKKQKFDPNQYPIDGFRTYGLDTFGDQYESLKRKGYLPEGFDKKFTTFKALNEIEEKNKKAGKSYNKVTSAAFKTEDDALVAKAAMLRNTRDNLNSYTKKTNIPLSDKQRDFFTLVGYNAGEGNMQKMIKSYKDKGYLKDDKFLNDTNFKPASFSQPYTYAQRRLQNMQVLGTEGYFQDYTPPTMSDTQTTDSNMANGGRISEPPDQKLARYIATYGSKGREILQQEELKKAQSQLPVYYSRSNNRYEPTQAVKDTKAALAATSLGTGAGTNPLSYLANVAGSVYDFGTAARYAADGQWENASIDAAQGVIGLLPGIAGQIGAKGNRFLSTGQQAYNSGIGILQSGSDIKTIGESFNNGGGLSRKSDYGSKKRPYPSVNKSDFAGGGRSYPIPTRADAVDALRLAGLHGRSDVKAKVYAKYPDLKKKKNDGGYITFNPDIYNDLYPDGEMTDFRLNDGGNIYTQKSNGFNPIAPQRKNPFNPSVPIANFGNGEGFYTEAVANDGINLPYRPNTVSTPGNEMWYQDPMEEAQKNISNYFNDPQNNQPINDATLNGDPSLQNNYVDQTGGAEDNTNQGPSRGQKIGQAISGMLSGVTLSTAPLITGTATIANLATQGKQQADEYARRVRRYSQQDVYNPIRYGTGSQAIMNDGGIMDQGPGKKLTPKEADARYKALYGPVENKINRAINKIGFDKLPEMTQIMLNETMGQFDNTVLPNGKPRNIPPVDDVIKNAQTDLLNLSDVELERFLKTDWTKVKTIGEAMRSKPSSMSVFDLMKYYNKFNKLKKSGYTFNDGGTVNNMKPLADNQFSSPIYEFVGPKHEEGGIDINYQGTPVEVEGGETVFMDNGGDLNVFGNMIVPGTNKKFKAVSKNIAKIENKTQYNLDKSVDLVNQNDPTSRYGKYRFNAGKVMMGANSSKLEELNEIKNELSGMQDLMLQNGYTEESSKKLKYGGKIPGYRAKYDIGGDISPDSLLDKGRGKKTTKSRTPHPAVELITPNINIDAPVTPPARWTTPIQDLDYTPPVIEPDVPINDRGAVPPKSRSSVPFGQILPEVLTIATERPEFVPGQTYEPNLYTPYQVSFQDRLNENNSSFRALQIANSNNPALVSQLAGQKYEADSRVLADEFRTNQQIQNQITNENIQLLNQAQLQNIQLTDQQMVRQSQARSNTRENIRNAINSISSKISQARLEDQTLAIYENMFPHFTYDKDGNLKFQDVQKPTFSSGLQDGGNTLDNTQRSRVKYDANGKVKETVVTTPSKRDQTKLDLQIDKARTQRLGLFKSIFGK